MSQWGWRSLWGVRLLLAGSALGFAVFIYSLPEFDGMALALAACAALMSGLEIYRRKRWPDA